MLKKIESDPEFLNNIWFTDESHFHLNCYVNKQNMRIWGSENPNLVIEKSAHSVYVTVWAAISYRGIIVLFFLNSEGVRETVRQENYRQMIENYFVPKLNELTGDEFEDQIFMQDGATPHTAKSTLELLKKYFGDRIISYKTENFWPLNSPDFNICDFYLWGDTKDKVFKEKPNNVEELKIKIIKVFSEIKKNFRKSHKKLNY